MNTRYYLLLNSTLAGSTSIQLGTNRGNYMSSNTPRFVSFESSVCYLLISNNELFFVKYLESG
jgi:hypothetical protein